MIYYLIGRTVALAVVIITPLAADYTVFLMFRAGKGGDA